MRINPIRMISEPIKREIAQRKELKQLTTQFLEECGDSIRYYDALRNRKSGTMAVLGYKSIRSPFTRAIAKKPDGTTIQTMVTRNMIKEGDLTDHVLKVSQKPDGKMSILTSTIHKLGIDTWCDTQKSNYTITQKQPKWKVIMFDPNRIKK